MVGRGKPPDPRNHNMHVVEVQPTAQPMLPPKAIALDRMPGSPERVTVEFDWPQPTLDWWRRWAESPLSENFTPTDWSELLDCALLHARFWRGEHNVAQELRLRTAKFGATPEDRARLRIQFAVATNQEVRAKRAIETNTRTSYANQPPVELSVVRNEEDD